MHRGQVCHAILVCVALSGSVDAQLNPNAERGREIYERGTSPSGASIEASLGDGTRIAGSILPCANCHGHDGLGKPESGIFPSNITWDVLTKPYRLANPDGRTHPPYTERLLRRAITMGIDAGGNTLNIAMPRFRMSQADASDLVAYIKELGEPVDPGLTPTTVRLGLVGPPPSLAEQPGIVKQTLLDYFARVNDAGGVFGRRIELKFAELPSDPTQRTDAVRDFLAKEQVFAVLGDFSGAESEIAAVMADTGTPAIAVLAPFPQTGSPVNRFVFYLDGGVKEEVQALLDFMSSHFPGLDRQTAIVWSDDNASRETARWLQAHLAESGHRRVTMSEGEQAVHADIVFCVRPEPRIPSVIVDTRGDTAILIPGSFVPGYLSHSPPAGAPVFVAFGMASGRGDAGSTSRLVWNRAIASAGLLTEALQTAGRNLSRAAFLHALENFNGVQTTLAAPVSFGPSRRVGTSGVQIMLYDPLTGKFAPSTDGDQSRYTNRR